ncbi:MAG: hypothetical protein ACXIUV_00585 [Alkalilacustris sp.]
MESLTPLETCLGRALRGVAPVPAERLEPAAACGFVLAEDLCLPGDMPPAAEALRAGWAVAALDLVGAGPGAPVPLAAPVAVVPGAAMPPGTDAVLAEDGIDGPEGMPEAIRSVAPGEGLRRAGHDGRAGAVLLAAGRRMGARHGLLAGLAGVAEVAVRRPRVVVELAQPRQADFAAAFLRGLGAVVVEGTADLRLRTAAVHAPRLALAPAETAWIGREAGALVVELPARFDGLVAGCLALVLPAVAALGGGAARRDGRVLARKLASAVGLAEVVLLAREGAAWAPGPAGVVTAVGLASAEAFAVVGPDSEGLPAGALLEGVALEGALG